MILQALNNHLKLDFKSQQTFLLTFQYFYQHFLTVSQVDYKCWTVKNCWWQKYHGCTIITIIKINFLWIPTLWFIQKFSKSFIIDRIKLLQMAVPLKKSQWFIEREKRRFLILRASSTFQNVVVRFSWQTTAIMARMDEMNKNLWKNELKKITKNLFKRKALLFTNYVIKQRWWL